MASPSECSHCAALVASSALTRSARRFSRVFSTGQRCAATASYARFCWISLCTWGASWRMTSGGRVVVLPPEPLEFRVMTPPCRQRRLVSCPVGRCRVSQHDSNVPVGDPQVRAGGEVPPDVHSTGWWSD
ncbi:unnamed protein product [Pieris macdunnoughi]|uniref:Uncharacterized protein n=1 Tax=Pieris macdunnoughi TaxID=345717 RepID=A0A821VQ77_9NEOP|nr:unnamed protein product [Pieris macdunnoughi]